MKKAVKPSDDELFNEFRTAHKYLYRVIRACEDANLIHPGSRLSSLVRQTLDEMYRQEALMVKAIYADFPGDKKKRDQSKKA